MRRLAALPLYVCLAAPCWSGCQTTQQTARIEPAQPETFWSANGESAPAELVSNRNGSAKVRFASRPNRNDGAPLTNFLPVGNGDRIPLPRTDEGTLRDIEHATPSEQPIGAF